MTGGKRDAFLKTFGNGGGALLLGKSPCPPGEPKSLATPFLSAPVPPSCGWRRPRRRSWRGEFIPDWSWVRDPSPAEEPARNPCPFDAGRGLFFPKGFPRARRRFAPCVAVCVAYGARRGGAYASARSSGGNGCPARAVPKCHCNAKLSAC